jgi:hypothetical protein
MAGRSGCQHDGRRHEFVGAVPKLGVFRREGHDADHRVVGRFPPGFGEGIPQLLDLGAIVRDRRFARDGQVFVAAHLCEGRGDGRVRAPA